jgi:hypothetical protein
MMQKASKISSLAFFGLFLVFIAMLETGCRKEKFITDGSAQLEFSEDTIIFDTVFTTVGSVTQYLKVYNPHKGIIRISEIYIEGGQNSNYRLNVDGTPGKSFTDVEIGAEDSIFIFVEVTVDPNSGTSPLILSDKIIFKTNGNEQKVDLVAWGQDAYFYKPAPHSNAFYMTCNFTLPTDKPNVFYGYAIVDENCDLTVPAGAKLHFHPGSGIIVYKGSLNVNGTVTNKVIIQGDRLEYDYQDVSGQWEGIRMIQPKTSSIKHAVVKNGFYGLWVDTTFSSTDLITLDKTEISNMASLGIYGNAGARITATNCLVKDCGLYGLALTYGGDFVFNHCTFGNYWSEAIRNTPNFYFKNWFETSAGDNIRDINLTMDNSIVYGNLNNEFETDLKPATVMNYVFKNCFIKSDKDLSDATHYVSISKNIDPGFEDPGEGKLKLVAGSACIGAANPGTSLPDDIDEKVRDASPDVGCYEF